MLFTKLTAIMALFGVGAVGLATFEGPAARQEHAVRKDESVSEAVISYT